MGPKSRRDGIWVYSPIVEALATVGLDEIGVYITCLHNTVAQYIATRPIMDLCRMAERNPVLRLSRKWWEQPALDILGIRAGHAASEEGEETGTDESEGEEEGNGEGE